MQTTTTTTRCLPTIAAWNDATTRAARLGVRLLIVAGHHVELIDAATGRVCGLVTSWEAAVEWIETMERDEWRRAA